MRSFSPSAGRRIVSALLVLTLLATPAVAQDDEEDGVGPHWAEIVFDIMVLRTLGTAQTIVGFGMFCVAGPLSAAGGGWDEAWDIFVQVPFEETFTRELGRF